MPSSASNSAHHCDRRKYEQIQKGVDIMIPELTKQGQQLNWRFCNKCGVLFFDGLPGKGICPGGGSHEPAGFVYVVEHGLEVPNTQRDWRFCTKCGVMFFDGFPGKGVCPGGGAHEAAGFSYVMEHDVAETANGQHDWRFCTKCGVIFFDGLAGKGVCPSGGNHQAAGFDYVMQHDVPESSTAQQQWRFCNKCGVLFFDGFSGKGVCPGGGAHEAAGFMYVMQHDVEIPTAQRHWRFCTKCGVMFFNGFPGKGVCPSGGGGHEAAGFAYALQHDVPEAPSAQRDWRFCNKCGVIFFDGLPGKGVCPGGGSHLPAGFNYVMLHDLRDTERRPQVLPDTLHLDSGPVTSDLPLGGSMHVLLRRNGSFTFQSHVHDSGFNNIDYGISAVMMSTTGVAFTFQHQGHVEGTIGGLPFGSPNRNDDFTQGGRNQSITDEWDGLQGVPLVTTLTGQDTMVKALKDLTDKALAKLGEKAVEKVVQLVF
jgi:hypothetical protein